MRTHRHTKPHCRTPSRPPTRLGSPSPFPALTGLLLRLMGFLMAAAYCLLFLAVAFSWPFVGWQATGVGTVLCVSAATSAWLCFSAWLRA